VPTAIEITDPHLRTYTRVLPIGPGVCDVCHGVPGPGWERCWSCAQTIRQVSRPIELVVPISLTELLGQLHHVLRSYKREDYPLSVRDRFRLQVSALLARFLWQHGDCIRAAAGEDWDCITIVPSSQGRSGVHPLEEAIRMFPFLADQYRRLLGTGTAKAVHNRASDKAFRVTEDVTGTRVLLVDDTFTSGARAQSAASALQLAGARVVAMVPIGRVIKPDFSTEAAALLTRARAHAFDFAICCLEGIRAAQ
jgi:predicted amidophosphoribosyltransferase